MTKQFDVVIIGAGPAGMSAALVAQDKGLNVAVIDEQSTPGGQIFRSLSETPYTDKSVLGEDYWAGESLVREFVGSDVVFFNQSSVWSVTDEKEVLFTKDGSTQVITYEKLILATGAMERTVPFKGWETPGVLTAGAAQILLKDAGTLIDGAVLVGSGPLLDVLASQYVKAGFSPKAIVDTTPVGNYFSALSSFALALKGWRYLLKGIRLKWSLRKAGIKRYYFAKNLEVLGQEQVSSVRFTSLGEHEIETKYVLAHFGVIPNINICRALGLETEWDESQLCLRPVLDSSFLSSRVDTYVVGDAQGISGVKAAQYNARVAMASILGDLTLQIESSKVLESDVAVRPFLESLFKLPSSQLLSIPDETIICKCEAIKLGDIKASLKTGSTSLNDLKVDTRCGMGPCQGRQCGNVISLFTAVQTHQPIKEVGYFKIRTPIVPVTFKEMSGLKK